MSEAYHLEMLHLWANSPTSKYYTTYRNVFKVIGLVPQTKLCVSVACYGVHPYDWTGRVRRVGRGTSCRSW